MSQCNIPVNETYWALVDKADMKFSKIREFAFYERARYNSYFFKVFKLYTQLWKFQQENRKTLVESGLKRWEIGEIASRIGQLYYGQYLRTSEASYLSESYIFYEAIMGREYFKEGLLQDLNIAKKQLRFLARFIMVCLVLNRREMVHQLVNQLKTLVDDCKKTFQESDFREWKMLIKEMVKFLKIDTAFINVRPLRYSLVLDPQPDSLLSVAGRRSLNLRDAILCCYHPREVKYSELTLDAFRMLQCLEWEPSGSFYQSNFASVVTNSQNEIPEPNHINYSQEINDPTLPSNPRKAVLYRPSVTHFLAVLATICEELPGDGISLIYFSALGSPPQMYFSTSESDTAETINRSFRSQNKGDRINDDFLQIGPHGNGGSNCIYPCDLIPFTRRPLFLIIDSESSKSFKCISGAEKGEQSAMLLSPMCSPLIANSLSGSLFTLFLTAPLPAFCILLGLSGSEIDTDTYNLADNLFSSSLHDWGLALEISDDLASPWAQVLSDPFLRRLLLRFVFCRAVLTQYAPVSRNSDFVPECIPCLPDSLLPTAAACETLVWRIADAFGVGLDKFVLPQNCNDNVCLPLYFDGDDDDGDDISGTSFHE